MDSEQRRKRKRVARTYSYSQANKHFFSLRSLVLCFSFFVFLLFLSSDRFPFNPASFRPSLGTHFLHSSASNSVMDSLAGKRQKPSLSFPARVGDRILFPDHVLVFSDDKILDPERLDCVYYYRSGKSTEVNGSNGGFSVRPASATDGYDEFRSIVRCPLPPANFSDVDLQWRGGIGKAWMVSESRSAVKPWDRLVYEAAMDGDTVVVFVKGLNLRPHRKSDPSRFRCRFGLRDSDVLATSAISAAQEIVRCALPKSIQTSPEKADGIRVTVSHSRFTFPSVAKLQAPAKKMKMKKKKHDLCVCTMVWNQAPALREWITYHAWLGVQRWFIYDNNSDDSIEQIVQQLDGEGYNVTKRVWPWIKTQEAGFSHCALTARDECEWIGFFDVDEFFFFPQPLHRRRNALTELVSNFSTSDTIGEIRTTCHSFGPSGLSSAPAKGVTAGYTCRLQRPERHKSIVRPGFLDPTLLNVVHHFRLREGFRYLNLPESVALVNHYKYQVWESFRAKFFRRVATYVVDWREDQNKGSKDRAPGLGTEPIEPPDWNLQFCEVWDKGLRDFVLENFADPATGSLPWEETSISSG